MVVGWGPMQDDVARREEVEALKVQLSKLESLVVAQASESQNAAAMKEQLTAVMQQVQQMQDFGPKLADHEQRLSLLQAQQATGSQVEADWNMVSIQDGLPAQLRAASRGKAVLVDHGAYNPPHLARVRAMALAKERLEAEGFEVVAGIMGVAPKSWVHKKGVAALSEENRAALIDVMADEQGLGSWLRSDLRGTKHKSYYHMIEGDLAAEYPEHTLFGLIDGNYACGRFQQGPCICVGPLGQRMPVEDSDVHFSVVDEQSTPFSYGELNRAIYHNDKATLATMVGEKAATVLLDLPASAWEPCPHQRWW
mmetsp:Transcript_26708/g.48988  ORF Transcript_26708/g.48988 Transcript_26708/m.48988 type:complete len:310 (-) Transcript_26708:127-1056(-)